MAAPRCPLVASLQGAARVFFCTPLCSSCMCIMYCVARAPNAICLVVLRAGRVARLCRSLAQWGVCSLLCLTGEPGGDAGRQGWGGLGRGQGLERFIDEGRVASQLMVCASRVQKMRVRASERERVCVVYVRPACCAGCHGGMCGVHASAVLTPQLMAASLAPSRPSLRPAHAGAQQPGRCGVGRLVYHHAR